MYLAFLLGLYYNCNKLEVVIDMSKYNNDIYRMYEKEFNKNEKLPKKFYSDVIYINDIKMLIVSLENYYNLPYNKIREFISDVTKGIISIAE